MASVQIRSPPLLPANIETRYPVRVSEPPIAETTVPSLPTSLSTRRGQISSPVFVGWGGRQLLLMTADTAADAGEGGAAR
jgi:hypothetical protein